MGSQKRHDPTYAALAAGPGSFKRAMEVAAKRPPPSEPAKAESRLRPPDRPQATTEPLSDPPASARADRPSWEGAALSAGPFPPPDASPAYRRVLEELSTYVLPAVADRMLRRCLENEGSSPDTAIPYDLRAILVEALPNRLRQVLSRERVPVAIEALEQALVHMHTPPSAEGKRRSSSGSIPAAGSVPP